MAVEVKTSGDHPASMEERIAKRLRSSGDPRADSSNKRAAGLPEPSLTGIMRATSFSLGPLRARLVHKSNATTTALARKPPLTLHKIGTKGDERQNDERTRCTSREDRRARA